jgi:hypothetical protein
MENPKEKKQYGSGYRVATYLPPRYNKLFNNYVRYSEESESAALKLIVKKFFDSMPDQELQRITNYSKNGY